MGRQRCPTKSSLVVSSRWQPTAWSLTASGGSRQVGAPVLAWLSHGVGMWQLESQHVAA